MEWYERLNQAIGYIEEHLTEEISYDELARIAHCSTYHFQRMFGYLAGITLSEYIRRRRLTLAAQDLLLGDSKILEIGLKYGYSSPTAFNRAFQMIHGIAPSSARKSGVSLKVYPPISFNVAIKGIEEMNYRIEEKDSFRIIGISMPLYKDLEKNFTIVPTMWHKATTDGTIQRLTSKMDSFPLGLLGVSACNDVESWRYFIAVASNESIDDTLEEYQVPASIWAIFKGSGTNESIQALERRIVIEWLPTSGYELNDAPDIEVYLNPDPANAEFEVWIPIKKKSEQR